ncbi:MAG: gfo/Idh/MocA family oxidoreductase, partial [Clostridia bacterium]|nr:gfo/Idh/MocA family oxidoreductase [Clostridia bacterium]
NTRDLKVFGTKASYDDGTKSICIDGLTEEISISKAHNNADEYIKKYDHPIWQQYEKDGIREGHGGMDWLTLNAFFDALKENKPMPIDVYDMATWMAVTPLSEQSISKNCIVDFPDFTNGKWVLY